MEVTSKTSAASTAVSNSILGHPISLNKRSILKQSKLANMVKIDDKEGVSMKEELDNVVK